MTFASIGLALRLDHYVYVVIHTISLFNQWADYPAHNKTWHGNALRACVHFYVRRESFLPPTPNDYRIDPL